MLPDTSGVYAIVNKVNDKMYIGSSVNMKKRCGVHRSLLKSRNHPNRHLQAAWDKYGAAKFEFRVLRGCSKESRVKVEQDYLNATDVCADGYNKATKTQGGFMEGVPVSEDTRRKISQANTIPISQRIERLSVPEPNSGCWLWTGCVDALGLPAMAIRKDPTKPSKKYNAKREAYHTYISEHLPPNFDPISKCGERTCVNPDHLVAVHRGHRVAGTRSGTTHFTDEDVMAIRSDTRPGPQIASEYNVTRSTINKIRRGESWAHLLVEEVLPVAPQSC